MLSYWITNSVFCYSNVAYHGELEKKAAMEQKRVMTGENGEPLPDGEYASLLHPTIKTIYALSGYFPRSLVQHVYFVLISLL